MQAEPAFSRGSHERLKPSGKANSLESQSKQLTDGEISRRRQGGEFVLARDVEAERTANAAREDQVVSQLMERKRNEYARFFEETGVPAQLRETILREMETNFRAKTAASNALADALKCDIYFDRTAQSLFGDNYHRFKEFEMSTPSLRETGKITDYLAAGGVQIKPEEERTISAMIQASGAYSRATLEEVAGPYHKMIWPFGGADYVPTVTAMYEGYKNNVAALYSSVEYQNLPPAMQARVSDYLESKVDEMERRVDTKGRVIDSLRKRLSDVEVSGESGTRKAELLRKTIEHMQSTRLGEKR